LAFFSVARATGAGELTAYAIALIIAFSFCRILNGTHGTVDHFHFVLVTLSCFVFRTTNGGLLFGLRLS
jgi:hypothetical protein